MRLRHEDKLKEKVEFQLDTRHVFYLVLWSIALSAAIFATGLFVGQKKQEGKSGYAMANTLAFQGLRQKQAGLAVDPLVSSFSFLNRLGGHPEKRELEDAVLNAMAKLRIEIREKVEEKDDQLKKELADKYFRGIDPADDEDRQQSPEELLAQSRGISAHHRHEQRMGQAPERLEAPEEEPVPEPVVAAKKPAAPYARGGAAPAKVAEKAPVEGPEEGAGGDFAIQAKAFRDKNDALIFLGYLKHELGRSRYKPFIMPVELPGKGKWYRVRIGKFDSRLKAQFEKRLGLETFLVSL
jgi:DedD protein